MTYRTKDHGPRTSGPSRAAAPRLAVWTAAVLAVVSLGAGASPAAIFTAPDGFSFTYPDGWRVNVNINGNPGKSYDGGVEVQFTGQAPERGLSEVPVTITAVITRERAGMNRIALEDFKNRLPSLVKNEGQQISDIDGSVIQAAGRKALSLTWTTRAGHLTMRKWMVQTTGGQKAYTIAFSAHPGQFERYRPVFQKALDTLFVPGNPQPDVVGMVEGAFKTGVVVTIVGVVLGGAVGLVIWLKKRSARQAAPVGAGAFDPSTPPPPPPMPPIPPAPTVESSASALEALQGLAAPPPPPPPADDAIRFHCACGQRIKVPGSYSGKKARCPKCQAVVQIP